MPASNTAQPGTAEVRAFVGIECDVPHRLSYTMDSYRGAYVKWGVAGQAHMHKLIYSGDVVEDFASAVAIASQITTNVYVSGTADYFCNQSGGLFEIHGATIFKPTSVRHHDAA